jgi:hypothetical protein
MFASVQINFLLTLAITAGCWISKIFAASVVAGAAGVFVACAWVLTRQSHRQAMIAMLRRFYTT